MGTIWGIMMSSREFLAFSYRVCTPRSVLQNTLSNCVTHCLKKNQPKSEEFHSLSILGCHPICYESTGSFLQFSNGRYCNAFISSLRQQHILLEQSNFVSCDKGLIHYYKLYFRAYMINNTIF